MMQMRLNSGLVKLDSGQALEGDNRSAESSSRKTILKASQRLAKSDVLPGGKGV